MRRVVVVLIAAVVAVLASAAPAAAHSSCPAGKRAVHHHKGKKGKVKHYCRQRVKRGRHARCRYGGHHHHRKRGRRVHYCAAKPRKRRRPTRPSDGAAPGSGLPAQGPGRPAPVTPLPGPASPAPAVPQPGPTTSTPTTPAPSRLQVTAREFTLVLSRPRVPPGPALVELVNRGEDPHDLKIGTAGHITETPAGERATGSVTLTAGSYTLYCSLPGHAALGMSATLTVAP